MDDKVYDAENAIAGGCAILWLVMVVFMASVVIVMACNWLHTF